MTAQEQERERRVVFGEAVEQYEAARPGYPSELVTDVRAYAPAGPMLEVGAGTGKATVAFAAGSGDGELTCLEPDPRMAAALVRNCPNATVVVSSFEEWSPDRPYGLVYSAQAWHWVDVDRRNDLALAALAPGGALALFWNSSTVADRELFDALAEADARHGLSDEHKPHAHFVDEYAGPIGDDFAQEWDTLRLAPDDRFTDLRSHRYRRTRSYTAAGYLELLTSISLYRMLAPERRTAVLADLGDVIDRHGGSIELGVVTDLALARRAPDR